MYFLHYSKIVGVSHILSFSELIGQFLICSSKYFFVNDFSVTDFTFNIFSWSLRSKKIFAFTF